MPDDAVSDSLEIERKYEVPAGARLPGSDAFEVLGLRVSTPERYELTAEYFDTPGAMLARKKVALRRREGGKDAGWHLKQKGGQGTRELRWLLSAHMPEGLLVELRAHLGDAVDEIVGIATVHTTRTVTFLSGRSNRNLVELSDDWVSAFDRVSGVRRSWHEWEAELCPGEDPCLLDRVEPVLLAAGAQPSLSAAKIARATGRLGEYARAEGASEEMIRALGALDAADRAAAARG